MVDEEIAFDPDIHASYLGRLLKVRETVNDEWRHGVPCFAETEWELEDYHGNGKMCKVEKPTGGYQLQWGLFERIEQAMNQKRSAKTVRPRSRRLLRRGTTLSPRVTPLATRAPRRNSILSVADVARAGSFLTSASESNRTLPHKPRSSPTSLSPSTWTSLSPRACACSRTWTTSTAR
jgi:hypothetical protein